MKHYTHLLFDLDGTLFDFEAAEKYAFQRTCQIMQLPYSQTLLDRYAAINESYWKRFERGEVTQAELAVNRFADLYSSLQLSGDAVETNYCYRRCLSESAQMFPDTLPVCEALSSRYQLCLVTNGIAAVQQKRLETSPLRHYISEVFVSEAVGSQKPHPDFFHYVFDHLNITPDQALVIGDSLTSDIRGAVNSGIDSCWFNPRHQINSMTDVVPTYEIDSLRSLLSFLMD